jgi:hypothetical protein
MGLVVVGAWVVGALAVLLAVLLWVNLRQLPQRALSIGAVVLGLVGCGLALAIPFVRISAVADIPDQKSVSILCGSLRDPQRDFTAYRYVGEDSSDPKLQGQPAGSQEIGPGGDPQRNCQSALSDARTAAIGGGALSTIGLLITIAYAYRRPESGATADATGGTAGSGSEAPDAEVGV